jgi:hypothetical protein
MKSGTLRSKATLELSLGEALGKQDADEKDANDSDS